MRTVLLSLIFSLAAYLSLAQHPGFEFNYPSAYAQTGYCIINVPDGGFCIAGYTGVSIGTSYGTVKRVGPEGEEIWTTFLGTGGTNFAWSVTNVENGFIVSGSTNESTIPANQYEAFLAFLNENGDVVWQKTYGGSGGIIDFLDVKQTLDFGIIAVGVSSIPTGYADVYVVKTNMNGDTLWTFNWGMQLDEVAHKVVLTSDGGYLITGKIQTTWGDGLDMLLIKLDSLGTLEWWQSYNFDFNEFANSIALDEEGNIILAGYTEFFTPPSVCIAKLNPVGELIWFKTMGGLQDDNAQDVLVDIEGNIVFVGNTANNTPDPYSSSTLTKLSADGDSLWTRMYPISPNITSANRFAFSLVETEDGYAFCGSMNARMYIIRTDYDGCVIDGCNIDTFINSLDEMQAHLKVYPNPSTDYITISFVGNHSAEMQVVLMDLTGRVVNILDQSFVQKGQEHSVLCDLTNISTGVYLIGLKSDGQTIEVKKVIKSLH
jgi:hypothetical protein